MGHERLGDSEPNRAWPTETTGVPAYRNRHPVRSKCSDRVERTCFGSSNRKACVSVSVIWFLLIAVGAIIGAEIVGWMDWLHRTLLKRTARRLPPGLQERYLEEWLAELAQTPNRPMMRLVWVASIVVRRNRLSAILETKGADVRTSVARRVVAFVALLLSLPVIGLVTTTAWVGVRHNPVYRVRFRDATGKVTGVGFRIHTRNRFLARTGLIELPYLFDVARGNAMLGNRRRRN